jgi:hypothetical protein
MPSDTLQSRLHHDLEMPTIQETTKQFYQQYRDRLERQSRKQSRSQSYEDERNSAKTQEKIYRL